MRKRCRHWAVLFFAAVLLSSLGAAQEIRFVLDPAKSTIEYTLGATAHTVHGTFRVKNGELRFDPGSGATSGIFVVDATTGSSGNGSRDRKMHNEVLESNQFPEITFTPQKVIGTIAREGQSNFQVEGIFRLRGVNHHISIPVSARIVGREANAEAHFIVPYVAWGLKDPSTFLLHVKKEVEISVTAQGTMQQK